MAPRVLPFVFLWCVQVQSARDSDEDKNAPNRGTQELAAGVADEDKDLVQEKHADALDADDTKNNGKPTCPCMGFMNYAGTVNASFTPEVETEVPAEFASYCSAWDSYHPGCKTSPQDWCTKMWCYVDPCDCEGGEDAVIALYFPSTTFKGRNLYFSYSTCGATDTFTAKYRGDTACRNKDLTQCAAEPDKCIEYQGQCVGKELGQAEASCRKAAISEEPISVTVDVDLTDVNLTDIT